MTSPDSIGDFLQRSGARYRLFDLGSQLRNLSSEDWQRFDQGDAYPLPYLNHAWLVMLLWHPDNKAQHSIWFMKLPLDEQGRLPVDVQTDVLNRLMRALTTADADERQRLLTDHPYQFTPGLQKMAALHARARRILSAPESEFYASAQQRLIHNDARVDWQTLGLQGIAEVLEQLKLKEQAQLARHLATWPVPLQTTLMEMLEHHHPELTLTRSMLELAQSADSEPLVTAAIRGLSQSKARGLVAQQLPELLERFPDSLDLTLAALSRHPGMLADVDLALVLLDRLARQADQDGFNRVIQGLALQPGLSGLVMAVLRHPNRSEDLMRAIGGLIQQASTTQ
ncbi:MAG: DUF3549 family protein [Saccharospirillum sp.]|nr:DUF3549 family protein [Saccharospirillum sp.]